jgi:hypothetical protein
MRTPVLAEDRRIDRPDLTDLIDLAAKGLVPMFEARRNLFCSRMVRTNRGLIRRGVSHRYTIISLLGFHQMGASGLVPPFQIAPVIDVLLQDTTWLDNLGDVGLLLWLCALASPDRLKDLCSRHALGPALDRYRDGRERRTMELSWFLSGLSHAAVARPELRENLAGVVFATYAVLKDNRGPHGTFGHQAQNGGWAGHLRGRIGTFADQVYPIYALTQFYRAFQCTEALRISVACAEQICRVQGPLGQWWWHYDVGAGKVGGKYPVYSVHQHGMAPMALFAVGAAANRNFDREIYRGLRWVYGRNELQTDMREPEAGVIWRCLRPAKTQMYYQKAISLLRAPLHGRKPRGVRTLYECWPYELGWLLYAFCPSRTGQEHALSQ